MLIPTWRTLLLTGLTWKIPVGTGESLLQRTPALKPAVSQGCPFSGFCMVAAQISVSLSQFLDKLPDWWGLVESGIEAQRIGLEGKSTRGRISAGAQSHDVAHCSVLGYICWDSGITSVCHRTALSVAHCHGGVSWTVKAIPSASFWRGKCHFSNLVLKPASRELYCSSFFLCFWAAVPLRMPFDCCSAVMCFWNIIYDCKSFSTF